MSRRFKVDTKSESVDKAKDATKKLRAENRDLKKQLKLARRELSRYRKHLNNIPETDPFEEELESVEIFEEASPKEVSLTCPQCHSHNITELIVGNFIIEVCDECGKRKKSKKTP